MNSSSSPLVAVYLGLGSNQDPHRRVLAGISALAAEFGRVALSPIYRSAAVGFSGADFLNGVALVYTQRSVGELKQWLTELENRHGRDRSQPKFSDRSLDIDILLYGEQTGPIDGLDLPRGEILKYAHVLRPLADLAPQLTHPLSGKTFGQHWQAFAGDRDLELIG